MRETGTSICQLALDGRAKELPGIGKVMARKVTMPARPFLGLDQGDRDTIRQTVDDWAVGLLRLA